MKIKEICNHERDNLVKRALPNRIQKTTILMTMAVVINTIIVMMITTTMALPTITPAALQHHQKIKSISTR